MVAAASWYDRFRDRRPSGRRPDRSAGTALEADLRGSEQTFTYLLESFRLNPPGVNDQDAFALSRNFTGITYLAVDRKAVQAGQAEVTLYEEDPDDPESRTPLSVEEDIVRLIREPNPEESFGEVLEQISQQEDLTGTALVWTPPPDDDLDAPPEEMYCLSTASCLPQPISPRYPQGAYMVQPWYPAGPYAQMPVRMGVGSLVPAEQVIRIKKPHPFFRWTGYSTLWAIGTQMDAARMIDVSRLNHFTQGFDPSAILSFDPAIKQPTPDDITRMQAQFRAIWSGPANAGRLAIVPAGGTLSTLSNAPAEMAYTEGWLQLLDFALACWGLNRAVCGMTEGLTYATLFASLRAFYLMTLDPFLSKVAARLTRKLIWKHYDRRFGMSLKGKSITDDTVRDNKAKTLGQFGAIKVGELRKMYELGTSERDEEWVGAGAGGAQGMQDEVQRVQAESRDRDAERSRPENREGRGALGGRDSGRADARRFPGADAAARVKARAERLGRRLEKAMTNGTVMPAGRK